MDENVLLGLIMIAVSGLLFAWMYFTSKFKIIIY